MAGNGPLGAWPRLKKQAAAYSKVTQADEFGLRDAEAAVHCLLFIVQRGSCFRNQEERLLDKKTALLIAQ